MNDKLMWGKHVWKALHYIALGYPDNPTSQQKKDYKNFYTLMKTVLPCKICRDHYIDNLKIKPLSNSVFKNRNNLVKWTIDLHNITNKQLNYPELSYEDAIKNIKSYEVCHKNNKWNIKKKV